MKLLKTICRQKSVNLQGKTFLREAVRGIIFREKALTPNPFAEHTRRGAPSGSGEAGRELLMIYSPVNGDYKFPGGGVDEGESRHETLRREIREESGATLTVVTGELGQVIEYATSVEDGFDTYRQNSYYYFCEINGELGTLNLEDYEEDLGFQPLWVDVETALSTNKKVLADSNPAPRWTRREVFILELLKRKKR